VVPVQVMTASWSISPGATGRWSVGRRWNETLTIDDDVATCSVLVDELNFWSEFTDDGSVSELGNNACIITASNIIYSVI